MRVEFGRLNWRIVALVALVGAIAGRDALAGTPRAREHTWDVTVATVQQSVRILLVRHGETDDDGTRDPALSAVGVKRGEALARMLSSAGVTRIYTTDYKRTRGMADAVAKETGVSVETYDPSALPAFAERLRDESGLIVVVGHSNTTPQLVQALGGEPGPPIDEPTEYDRLYIVVPQSDGFESVTVLLRYGD